MNKDTKDLEMIAPAGVDVLQVAVAGLPSRGTASCPPYLSRFNLNMRSACLSVAALFFVLLFTNPVHARSLDVPFVPTPHTVVATMLDMADVGPGDYVIDLGSGDGRIVIAAAKRGAIGHGMDLDPQRVSEAEANAAAEGVSDKALFLQGDLFEADMSRATVVTMFLLGTVNMQLKPVLFEQLRPGTRIVSNTFSMGRWEADGRSQVDGRNIFYWVIPADVGGKWQWRAAGERFEMEVEQQFQKITINLYAVNRRLQVQDPAVAGERIHFVALDSGNGKRYAFSGRVEGEVISGTFQLRDGDSRKIENWDARRTER